MTFKSNLNFLRGYKLIAKRDVEQKVAKIIELYEARKISNVTTARNLLDKLTASNKNVFKSGVKLYDKTVEKYENAEPLPVKRKRVEEEKIQKVRRDKATLKIQNLLRKTILFDITKKESAMDNKVIDFTVKPQRVGTIVASDLKNVLYKAYAKVIKQLPTKTKFEFYSEVAFEGKAPLASNSYLYDNVGRWATHVEKQIEKAIQSDETIKLSKLKITFHFILHPAGGRHHATQNRDKESVLNKTSVVKVVNEDDNCFWYALSVVMNKTNKMLKDHRCARLRERVAKELCNKCKLPWDNKVSFLDLPLIEEALNCNIYVLDLNNIPVLGSKIDVWNMLMYKSPRREISSQYWLLFDEDHYHSITNIRGFLAADHFCHKCFQCFKHKETFEKHECKLTGEKTKKRIKRNDHRTNKDLAHYLKQGFCKGSKEELKNKLVDKKDEKAEEIIRSHNHPRMIVFDFETDTHTLTHIPNHCEVDVLEIDEDLTHDYEKCLIKRESFPGYGCEDDFCEWLFSKDNQNSTVIAHNGSGYDNKFILKWCISKGMTPDSYVRQGSHITYMAFKKFNLRFVDSCSVFLEKLSKLSNTYDIDTVEGNFPHHFNTPENQDYVGCIPCEDMFGAKNLQPDEYEKDFLPWYNQQKDVTDWSFKEEMVKYCRADVELLSKAILKFRKMFLDSLDVDPFRHVTLASLCMSIYLNKFLPEKTIVGNSTDKDSLVAREWLLYLSNKSIIPEYPIVVDKRKFSKGFDGNKNKIEDKTYYSGKHTFTVDGFDEKKKVVKEFYGCFWHGCRKCHPELVGKYDRTMERQNMLEEAGYKVECIWECEWNEIKKTLENKQAIEQQARDQHINVREALFGGRTEGFKSYFKCNKHQKIYYYDVVSLYPTVNAMDAYAIGFKKPVNVSDKEALLDRIRSGEFFGIVKVDVTPPRDLYTPVLPDNSNSKLLFHLNQHVSKTYASVELKKALEKGYVVDKIYAAYEYEKMNGLMKKYVGNFLKMKVENSGVKNQEECDKINESHKELGFDFEIKPENTRVNPGLRQVAKICLNSLWGKFGQRSTLNNYDFYYDFNKLLLKMNDSTIQNKKWHIVNKNCVELRYENDMDIAVEADYISEITAVFTTANARMRLYDMLDWLHPSQICYCDTDSVMFVYDETNPDHKAPVNSESNPKTIRFGNGLGEWEDEFKGGWITELVVGGAKSYAYVTNKGKTVIKQKGITLDKANSSVVTFETMKNMVLNDNTIESEERFQFRWQNDTKDIVTVNIGRSIRSTISEKRTVIGYDTLPFGYQV